MTDISTTWAEVIFFNHYEVTNSDDNLCSGCQNLYQQQSFSGLHPPKKSDYTITCYPPVQTICCNGKEIIKKKTQL